MQDATTFDATFRRYPFAPFVELGLKLAAWLARWRKRGTTSPVGGAALQH